MATKIPIPAITNPDTEDWQKSLHLNERINGAFNIIGIAMQGTQGLAVQAGSRFEINGSFFEVATNELIITVLGNDWRTWANLANNTLAYIYAVPNGDICTFGYSIIPPVLDVSKGGLFFPNVPNQFCRCVGSVMKLSTTNYELNVLSSQWMVPFTTANPLRFDSQTGILKWQLRTLSLADEVNTQNGDMWITA